MDKSHPDRDAEAAVYLMVKYNLPMFRSRALVKLVAGGRFSVLNKIGYFPATKPLRQIISPFWKKTRDSLDLLRLDPTDRFFFALVTKTTVASLDPNKVFLPLAPSSMCPPAQKANSFFPL